MSNVKLFHFANKDEKFDPKETQTLFFISNQTQNCPIYTFTQNHACIG